MKKLPYTLVDVFTDTALAGNQLAVFTEAADLDAGLMQRLARELNLSETTFVVGRGSAGHRVRIFTPEAELPFAGHPTLGTAATLMPEPGSLVLELEVGWVPVEITRTPAGGLRAELTAPAAHQLPCAITPAALAEALGLHPDDLDPALPPAIWSSGNAFAFVAARRSAAVSRAALRLSGRPEGWPLGIVLFSLEGEHAHARVFCPGSAVIEDPATGSANAPLVAMLHAAGRIAVGQSLFTRQGAEIGRPSHLEARLVPDDTGALRPHVAGGVVRVASGTFEL